MPDLFDLGCGPTVLSAFLGGISLTLVVLLILGSSGSDPDRWT